MQGKKKIAEFGQLHPSVAKKMHIKNIDDYAGLNDLLTVRMFYSNKDKRENISDTEQIACTFFDEYCSGHDYNYVFVKSLFDFAVSGKLRHDLIERDIRKIFERASTPEGLAFDRLRDFWNAEEVKKAVKNYGQFCSVYVDRQERRVIGYTFWFPIKTKVFNHFIKEKTMLLEIKEESYRLKKETEKEVKEKKAELKDSEDRLYFPI